DKIPRRIRARDPSPLWNAIIRTENEEPAVGLGFDPETGIVGLTRVGGWCPIVGPVLDIGPVGRETRDDCVVEAAHACIGCSCDQSATVLQRTQERGMWRG